MSEKNFKSCPLYIDLDTQLIELLTGSIEATEELKERNPSIPDTVIEAMLLERDDILSELFEDNKTVRTALAAGCIGVQANGKCCLVGLTPAQEIQRFGSAAISNVIYEP